MSSTVAGKTGVADRHNHRRHNNIKMVVNKLLYDENTTEVNKLKVRGKSLPLHAMKAYTARRGTAPLILKLGAR
jgi:hypothetical protein